MRLSKQNIAPHHRLENQTKPDHLDALLTGISR
jgi:hypothetical protein